MDGSFIRIQGQTVPVQNNSGPAIGPVSDISGFANLGNTCYLNSALQCILNDSLFLETAEKHRSKSILLTLLLRLKVLNNVQILREIITILSQKNKDFANIYMQNDAHETLFFLLDCIHEDIKDKTDILDDKMTVSSSGSAFKTLSRHDKNIESMSKKSLLQQFSKLGHSFINDIYMGQFITKLTCSKCRFVQNSFSTFQNIVLDIDQTSVTSAHASVTSMHINECIKNYLKPEIISDYNCESCKTKCNVIKKTNFLSFPKRFVITLNRFNIMLSDTKNKTHITFERYMRFRTNDVLLSGYRLAYVIHHLGHTHNSGHYVTDIIKETAIHRADDTTIQNFINSQKEFNSNTAYVLIYEEEH
jgi:ubiquitin C-terminal hydrolase